MVVRYDTGCPGQAERPRFGIWGWRVLCPRPPARPTTSKGQPQHHAQRVKRRTGTWLERALEAEKGCTEVMQQIAAFRGAANGLMTEVIEEHVRTHVASASITSNASRTRGADELIEIVRTYLR